MWVIVILGSLAVLLVFLLCVPLDMLLQAEVYGKPKVRLRLTWFFGLISREISGKKEKSPKQKRVAGARKKRRRGDIGLIFKIIRTKGVLRRSKELLKGLLSCFSFRDLAADFKIGLGDPAATGLLFAIVGPATVFLGPPHLRRINLQPSFGDDAILEGYSQGTIRLRPIRIVTPVMKFVFSMAAIRVAGTLISNRWKRRKK